MKFDRKPSTLMLVRLANFACEWHQCNGAYSQLTIDQLTFCRHNFRDSEKGIGGRLKRFTIVNGMPDLSIV